MAESNDNSPSPPPPEPRRPSLDRVGRTLRNAFDDIAAEPLPQAFEDLLRQLR